MKTESVANIEKIIGYAFKDKKLLERAFIHSSYVYEHGGESYDRLEFLGDSVLELIVAERLYAFGETEGEMTARRARIVSSRPLEECVVELGLNAYLVFGAGESRQEHTRSKVLSDLYEAILGAIYLDGGLREAQRFVSDTLGERIAEIVQSADVGNSKGELQEYCQARKWGMPVYAVSRSGGKEHCPTFFAEVSIDGKAVGSGSGAKKREAEQNAAKSALEKLPRKEELR